MQKIRNSLAAAAIGFMAAQPCLAADMLKEPSQGQRSSSAFAGLNVSLPLGQAVRAKPSARLQFTTAHSYRDMRTGAVETFKPQGLEIGAAKFGKPTLYLNGQSTADVEKKLGVGGSTGTVLLIAGGVVLTLFLLAALLVPPQPDFDDDSFK